MKSQELLKKLAHKVRNRSVSVFDQSLRYQRGLGYRSFAPVRKVLPEQSSGITCLTLERNRELYKIYTFNIHCCYCLKYRSKLSVRARTTSKWRVTTLCAQKKIAFELITPQTFVVSMIAYRQRVKFLLALIKDLPFTFTFVQPFQILGLEKLYEVCGTKERYLPVTTFLCSCHFGDTMNPSINPSKVIKKLNPSFAITKLCFIKVNSFVKVNTFFQVKTSVKPMYGEDIIKLKLCSTSLKLNSDILKRCEKVEKVNHVSFVCEANNDYRILALRSSAILRQERKKLKIIRPLLDFKRESITMVCKDLQIPVYPDKSNRSVQYSRNRIRKQIIPSIKHFINPQVESSLFKVAQLLQKEQFFVYSLLKNTSVNVHL